ncbi:HU family DNA-binding protein [Pseudokineococcus sp. 1T1Z-3]|uniref:HU family DNA-binding protein n=1 Tax=Pseudokineococcus sp. 1T1Z-3 TaxID=3132745 RepID=UPI0030B5E822
MNKGELVDVLEERLGSRRAASDAMEAVLDAVVRSVAKGERVAISGFGTFERADRAPRTGRNPRTGETVPIAGTSVPRFKPGTAFRALVADPSQVPAPEAEPVGGLRAVTTRRSGVDLEIPAGGLPPLEPAAEAEPVAEPVVEADPGEDAKTKKKAKKDAKKKDGKKAKKKS